MDGSDLSPTVMVEVTGDVPLILERPGAEERRAAKKGEKLFGREALRDGITLILFEDGFAIRKNRLETAWDDLQVEVSVWDGTKKARDFF